MDEYDVKYRLGQMNTDNKSYSESLVDIIEVLVREIHSLEDRVTNLQCEIDALRREVKDIRRKNPYLEL